MQDIVVIVMEVIVCYITLAIDFEDNGHIFV